jgi:ferric-dicitrate binding protein FerR (iron transport regulator)
MQQRENIPEHLYGNDPCRGNVAGRTLSFRLEVPARRSRAEVWQLLEQKISGSKVVPLRRRRLPLRALTGAAATVALLLTFSLYITFHGIQKVSSVTGESFTCLLPDSSEVILHGSSAIRYNRLLWPLQRKVSLEGEAFFRVRKGKKFTVTTRRGNITVLGTRFTVLTRTGHFQVACYSGKVRVAAADTTVILRRGMQVTSAATGTRISLRRFDPSRTPSWHQQGHYFSKTPLDDVLKAFARHYHARLDYTPEITHNRYYTGYLKENDRDKAIEMICLPMGLQYTLQNKHIKITKIN